MIPIDADALLDEMEAILAPSLLSDEEIHDGHPDVTADMLARAELHPVGGGDLTADEEDEVDRLIYRLTGGLPDCDDPPRREPGAALARAMAAFPAVAWAMAVLPAPEVTR